jgi:hypothetical protein
VDPAGQRVPREAPQPRFVEWFPAEGGLVGMYAQLGVADAAALEQALDGLADGVCRGDPRSADQRRADGLGALAGGLSGLRCECGCTDCTATRRPTGQSVVIHVLAEQATVAGTAATPGHVAGVGPLPAATVRDLAGHGQAQGADHPPAPRAGGAGASALGSLGGVHPVAGFDVSVSRL